VWGARTLRLVISFSTQADMNCCFITDLLYSAWS
jgi:hypothetical protein